MLRVSWERNRATGRRSCSYQRPFDGVKRIQGFGLQQTEEARESVDINQLVQDSTSLTRARWSDEAQIRGLHYDVEMDLQPTRVVRGAASELREVFVNMILNALDAMPAGGTLRLRSRQYNNTVTLEISDTGQGLTQEECQRLFTPYYTTKQHGTGLGLAIVQSVVSDHGGAITVESVPGRGATFRIELPLRLPERAG